MLVGLDSAVSQVTGLQHWAHRQLGPLPAVHLHFPGLNFVTNIRCCVPVAIPYSHKGARQQGPINCIGAQIRPSLATGLHHWAHLQLPLQLCTCTLLA